MAVEVISSIPIPRRMCPVVLRAASGAWLRYAVNASTLRSVCLLGLLVEQFLAFIRIADYLAIAAAQRTASAIVG